MQRKLSVIGSTSLIALVLLTSGPVSTFGQQGTVTPIPTAAATATAQIQGKERFFAETGFTVPGVFNSYWSDNGGLPVFGYPLSEARMERSITDGKDYLVQYFERNRFEHHPEFAGTRNEVLLGLLGAELTRGRTFSTIEPFQDTSSKIYLAPTKHSLAEPFLSYWNSNGGLGIFGYPISEPFNEVSETDGKTYLVQYFQRNRFEYHPENKPPYHVLLGLLGRDFMELQSTYTAWGPPIPGAPPITQPIWKPAKPAYGTAFLKGPAVGDGMIIQGYYQDLTRIYNLVKDLNYTWVKQQVEWKNTEDPKGSYHWEEPDRIVNAAQTKNVKVMLSVVKAPNWATGGRQGFPRNPQDLGDFMRAMAAHYKGRVDAYEIWNEYNLVGEAGEINPGRYVEMLKEAYLAVKSQDPNAIIIAGALTPTGVNDPEGKRAPGAEGALSDTKFLEEMYLYKDGMFRRYFDVMGSHPYGFNNHPNQNWPDNPNLDPAFPKDVNGNINYYNRHNSFYFRRIEEQRAIMEKYGDGHKQMWLTEYGWCSDFRPDGYGECRFNTQQEQGEYTLAAIERAKKYYPWMGVMFLWNLNFSTFQPWYTGPAHFSILNGDWTARPAYFTLKNRPK